MAHAQNKSQGRKAPRNITLDPELLPIADRYFGTTKYGSLSGFVNAKLRTEFVKAASVIRAIGVEIPDSILKKAA